MADRIAVYNMDAMAFLDDVPAGQVKAMFADPPDNIGLDYGLGKGEDKMPASTYYAWLELLILKAMLKCKVLVLSYYHKHDLTVSGIVGRVLRDRHPSWAWQKAMWHFTFGQYNPNGLTNNWRPILILTAPSAELHYDAIKIVSSRAVIGDARAPADGLRGDVDVWSIPRVVGNSPERRAWHPTQHPEELMSKIMRLCGSPFVDLFGGTGTTIRVAKRLGVQASCVELSRDYASRIASENGVPILESVR